MGAPKQITPKRLGDYLEVMSKAVFQSGISWQVVDKKWLDIREAFDEFDPLTVASFTTRKLNALAEDPRVIRNRRKLGGIVHNARTMIALEERHGSFGTYLRAHADFEALVKDLRKRFKFLGDTGAYYFLWVVREPVPEYEEWCRMRGVTPKTVAS